MRIGYLTQVAVGVLGLGAAAWPAIAGRLDPASVAATALPLVAVFVAGAYAVARRPDQRAARRLLLAGALMVASFGASAVVAGEPAVLPSAGAWLLCVVALACQDIGFAAWFDVLACFPDGRYPHPWVRRLTVAAYGVAGLVALLSALRPSAAVPFAPGTLVVDSPLPVTFGRLPALDSFLSLLVAAGAILLFARYVGAGREVRLRIRWPLAACLLVLLVVALSVSDLLGFLPSEGRGAELVWGLVLSMVPLSLVAGMLWYRLFDLDSVLRRSLIYGVLWAGIAAGYAAVAALLGVAAGRQLPLTVAVLVTIAAAMAFQPARVRLEKLADRLVFGHRLEGHELIRELGAALESAVPPDELGPRLARTVRQGLRAEWASLRTQGMAALDGTRPDGQTPALAVELGHAGTPLGGIECGPRVRGDYTAADQRLLEGFAVQAALALDHARLTALVRQRADELAASRTRIVEAESAARRRIERDIHDGVQQQLVALMAGLSLALVQLADEPDRVEGTLTAMQTAFRHALADLRDLASGIHPGVLTDHGLRAAVEALAGRLPIGVTVQCRDGTAQARFDDHVEAAAYFCVAEAFTNAIKHGAASEATVAMARAGGMLYVAVDDDGLGFDPAQVSERGLQGIRDRIESLGGTLTVVSRSGAGTRVELRIPARQSHAA